MPEPDKRLFGKSRDSFDRAVQQKFKADKKARKLHDKRLAREVRKTGP